VTTVNECQKPTPAFTQRDLLFIGLRRRASSLQTGEMAAETWAIRDRTRHEQAHGAFGRLRPLSARTSDGASMAQRNDHRGVAVFLPGLRTRSPRQTL